MALGDAVAWRKGDALTAAARPVDSFPEFSRAPEEGREEPQGDESSPVEKLRWAAKRRVGWRREQRDMAGVRLGHE